VPNSGGLGPDPFEAAVRSPGRGRRKWNSQPDPVAITLTGHWGFCEMDGFR
jgi:hypothetical protein